MRILVVHNFYQHKGGEDVVFQQEVDALSKEHSVETMTFRNEKGLKGLIQFALYPWNIRVANKIAQKALLFKADIVHIHNTHYAIGPWVFRTLHRQHIKTVQTLHNYRLLDPSATLFHEDEVFLDTLNKKFPWASIKRKSLDNSAIKTGWVAFVYYFHHMIGTWHKIDRYLVFSNFMKLLLLQSSKGIEPHQISIKTNAISAPVRPEVSKTNHFVYIGRLAVEKGIKTLIAAFAQLPEYSVEIYGDGPMAEEVKSAAAVHHNIVYKGFQTKEILNTALASSQALIVPSIWFEGMPMTILEAYAMGTPVIGSKIGALEDMIVDLSTGYHFEAGNAVDLADKVRKFALLNEEDKQLLAANCLKEYEVNYQLANNMQTLEDIYKDVLERN